MLLGLTGLELRSIIYDGREHEQDQNRAECLLLENFKDIARGIDTSIATSKNLDSNQQETNRRIAALTPFIRKPSTIQPSPEAAKNETTKINTTLSTIAHAVSGDPKRYLVAVAVKVDNAIRTLLARSGKASSITDDPKVNATVLAQAGYISPDLGNAASQFFEMKDRLVNSMGTSQGAFTESGAAGADLLKALVAIPMSREVVVDSDFALFGDESGKQQLPGQGVMLDVTEPDGKKRISVFSTTRVAYYTKGMDVSWEWKLSPIWGKAYYLDKPSKTMKLAFEGSANFNGRDLRELLIAGQ